MRTPPGEGTRDMYWDLGPGTMDPEEWEEAQRARAIRLRYDSCRIDPDGSDGTRLKVARWLAATFAIGLLFACGAAPGVEQPIHAQTHTVRGTTEDLKCWRMESVLYQQFGAEPHLVEHNPAERDCLAAELKANGWRQLPDGTWEVR